MQQRGEITLAREQRKLVAILAAVRAGQYHRMESLTVNTGSMRHVRMSLDASTTSNENSTRACQQRWDVVETRSFQEGRRCSCPGQCSGVLRFRGLRLLCRLYRPAVLSGIDTFPQPIPFA